MVVLVVLGERIAVADDLDLAASTIVRVLASLRRDD